VYDPSGLPWTFQSTAGVTGNGSAFTADNPSAPQGSQVAFVQGVGSISETFDISGGTFVVSLDAAQRGSGNHGGQEIEVLVDGAVVGTITPLGAGYSRYSTAPFTISAGSHTIELLGLDLHGGDNTAFVDQIDVQAAAPNQPFDPGFELPAVGSGPGAYVYDPSGSPWTFQSTAGVTGNGSAFTADNPSAPQGSQVAFVQGGGSISQSFYLDGGSYILSLDSAQRGSGNHGGQQIEVLVDGAVVGTITPLGTGYQRYSTASLTVAAGIHTIELLGLNPNGGDNTAFVDDLTVSS
jgi:hypothetical protein